MSGEIFETLLDSLPKEKREIIEEFFETATERMLENAEENKFRAAQHAAAVSSKFLVDEDNHHANFRFLIPVSCLTEIPNLPDMDWGAPAPILLASEHRLAIGYYLSDLSDWDGETAKLRQPKQDEAAMVIFFVNGVSSFSKCGTLQPDHLCAYFDYDEESYPSHGVWEVKDGPSSAIKDRSLSNENDKHLVFSFHDSSIECFCADYKFDVRKSVSIDLITQMAEFVYS